MKAHLISILLVVILGGCTSIVGTPVSEGKVPVPEFFYPVTVGIPGLSASASITQLTPELAVTAEHARVVAYPYKEVGSSPAGYDLYYFLKEGEPAIIGVTDTTSIGDTIRAFGVTSDGVARYVEGTLVNKDFWFNRKATSCSEVVDESSVEHMYLMRGPLTQGFSGGPVVDLEGRLVGVMVAVVVKPCFGSNLEVGDGIFYSTRQVLEGMVGLEY